MLYVRHNLSGLQGRCCAHTHVVFHVGRGGDGVYAGGMRQHFVFGGQGGGGILDDHKAGVESAVFDEKGGQYVGIAGFIGEAHNAALRDVAQFSHRHAQIIQGDSQGFAVKITAGEDGDLFRFIIDEDERVIGNGVQFDLKNPTRVSNGIAHCAVNLRDATQGIGVLHVARIVMAGEVAANKELAQVFGAIELARVGPQLVDAVIEGQSRAVQGFQTEYAGDIGHATEQAGAMYFQRSHRAHNRRAVGQRQPFFGGQHHRTQVGAAQSSVAGQNLALIFGFALPQHHQAHMRQRSQITAGAQRAFLGNDGMHARVEHIQQKLQGLRPDAGMSPRQRVGANEHDGAGGGNVEGIAHAHRVTGDDVALQGFHLIRGDDAVFEGAKAGGDTVGNFAALEQGLHRFGSAGNFGQRGFAKGNAGVAGLAVSGGYDFFDGQAFAVKGDGFQGNLLSQGISEQNYRNDRIKILSFR